MGQITTGINSLLNDPLIYELSQKLFGVEKVWTAFSGEFIRSRPGDTVLDIGCGTAEILARLPGVDYWGFDISSAYIKRAEKKFGAMGHFFCKELREEDLSYLPAFDIVLAMGVLHHLDDAAAERLLGLAKRAMKPGGRLLTMDPCLEAGQNPVARRLILWDRGQNVRTRENYVKLVSGIFPKHQAKIRHKTGVPYTHCMMECSLA